MLSNTSSAVDRRPSTFMGLHELPRCGNSRLHVCDKEFMILITSSFERVFFGVLGGAPGDMCGGVGCHA